MWKLVIEDDEGKRTVVPLTRDDYSIGRQEGRTIRLTERNVSREHARIRRKNGGGTSRDAFVIEDHKSYNGVFVNGLRVAQSQDLQNGDLIQIGDYRIVLQDDAATTSETQITTVKQTTDFDAKATLPMATVRRGQTLAERPSRFVMLVGPIPGVEYPLDRERMTIGRAEDCSISVNHNSVSRLHCEVHAIGDGRFEIVDKGSSNGVRVNAVELRRSLIEAGDVIELGDVRFKFVGAGQIFVPGPNESQQLTAISDREAELVDPRKRSWRGYGLPIFGAGLIGALVILAGVYAVQTRTPTGDGAGKTNDPEQALVMDARRACTIDDCDASYERVWKGLSPQSTWRTSNEVKQITAIWADSLLKKARASTEVDEQRAILERVANSANADEARRKQAADQLAALNKPAEEDVAPTDAAQAAQPAPTHSQVAVVAAPPTTPTKPATTRAPQASVTTSNASITSPTPKSSPTPSSTAPTPSVLDRARTAALEGRPGEVRSLLEARVRSGHATPDEVKLVRGACQAQGDIACVDDIRKKY